MKLCFLVSDLSPSGGIDIVLGHAECLAEEHDFDVDVVTTARAAADAPARGARLVRSADEAAGAAYDVAVSTWWETAATMWHLDARVRIAFLQSAEEYFYDHTQPFDRLGAALALRAADGYVTVSSWLADLARGLRPGAPVALVPNGVDKDIFDGRRAEAAPGPLRVLVEGQPSVWFKGVHEALSALADVANPVDVTVVCRDPAEAAGVPADNVVGGLDPHGMAGLYASTDVLVKLSSLEGLGLAPLEAFHHGVPCIVTPYGGHADYVRHGENGFVVGFDDPGAVTRLVGRLAEDHALVERLRQGAYATAAAWPTPKASSARLAEALRSLEPAPSPVAPLFEAWRVAAEQDRPHREALAENALEEARRAIEELEASRAHVNGLLLEREAEIEVIKASRAYRAAVTARSALERIRR